MIIAIAWPISILLTAFVVWLITDSAAYQRGHAAGYEAGAKYGYEIGAADGHKSGDAEGYERARKDGIESERAMQESHRQTVATPAAQAEKPARTPKRGNGARAPKR